MTDDPCEEEEEEEEEKPKRRGNPYFAPYFLDTFTSSYRGTGPGVRRGSQTVTEDDTIGTLNECWCGEPFDHTWPGKAQGRKHPRGNSMSETDTLDRRSLRAYHSSIQDFVLHEVRINGLRYRLKTNALLLYPPDGSNAITIYARNNDSQLRSLGQWHARHVEPALTARVDVAETVEPEAVEELAKAVNDPVEHPRDPIVESVVKKMYGEPGSQVAAEEDEMTRRERIASRTIPTGLDLDRVPFSYGTPRGYTWYLGSDGDFIDGIATDGTICVCVACLGTDHPWSGSSRGIGGHRRMWHSTTSKEFAAKREALKRQPRKFTDEDRAKGVSGNRRRKELRQHVGELCRLLDFYPPNPDGKADPKMVQENLRLTKRVEELEAKLSLIREGLAL